MKKNTKHTKTNPKRSLTKNKALLARARKVVPRAAQTLSKAPDQFVEGVSPYAIARGKGARVWDVDGNEYIDLTSSLGAMSLGHQHPVTEKAVAAQRKNGTIFALPAEPEIVLAEKLTKLMPFIEMARFGLNGSDATSGAVRTARAYTGRDHIAKCGYHGWSDWTIATHPVRSGGVPQAVKDLTHEFGYNNIESLKEIFKKYPNQIAAVILEPMHTSVPKNNFLQEVKKVAHENGAVLIFDELVTGFRLALGGAASYFGVEPDVVCYGKAISNGEPFSVLAGSKKILSVLDEKDIFFSFTYAGYLPSIAAAIATIDFMQKNKVHKMLWKNAEALAKFYVSLAKKYGVPTTVGGLGPVQFWIFKNADGTDNLLLKSLFLQECAKAGLLTNCSVYLNASHDAKTLTQIYKRLEKVFSALGKAVQENRVSEMLEGPVIRPRARSTT